MFICMILTHHCHTEHVSVGHTCCNVQCVCVCVCVCVVCPAGADVLSQAQDEASVLYEASAAGDPAVISLLLEHGADANVAKHSGHMPIHRVAQRGHLQ